MNLQQNKLWVAISLGVLSGSAFAVPVNTNCTVTPVNSIITEGQTLQLQADCGAVPLKSINWLMHDVDVNGVVQAGVSVTGNVLGTYPASTPIYYTTPVGLGGNNAFVFSVTGVTDSDGVATTLVPVALGDPDGRATVVVKPSSAVLAKAAGSTTPTTPVDAACGTANGDAVTAMPTNGEQCDLSKGTPALAISGPTAFTWSCLSLNGGLEANCSALRGYTVYATAGANGSVDPASQGVAAGGTAIVTASPASGYSASMSGCGGTQSGNTFTTGPVNANCTVSALFSNLPVNGACGTANGVTATSAPSANLCTTGTASAVSTATAAYSWTCAGTNGGATASCSAPHAFTVTASAGANGSISPASKNVVGNTTTTFAVTPGTGYVATVTGCGGSLLGTTYTTGAITAACAVSATFAPQPVSTTDPGIGKGLWVSSALTKRTFADQTGTSATKTSYVPGCLNGSVTSSSGSGCALNTSFTGTLYGTTTNHTVSLGGTGVLNVNSGNQLVLRYQSTSTAGVNNRWIIVRSSDAGNVGVKMRVWLSADPMATYDSVPSACKQTSATTPMVITGPGYCPLEKNRTYYFGLEYDDVGARRFQVDETGADFL